MYADDSRQREGERVRKISDKLYSAQITSVSGRCKSAYVISHKPVTEYFEGVVVAVAEFDGLDGERPIISQYGEVFYEPELRQVLSKLKNIKLKSIVCLYEKSCGAVIFYKSRQNTKILLVKNSNGRYWSFPKGHIEDGENEHQTAIREIKEETGLDVVIERAFVKSANTVLSVKFANGLFFPCTGIYG